MARNYSALYLVYNLRVDYFTHGAMVWESQCFILGTWDTERPCCGYTKETSAYRGIYGSDLKSNLS